MLIERDSLHLFRESLAALKGLDGSPFFPNGSNYKTLLECDHRRTDFWGPSHGQILPYQRLGMALMRSGH